MVLILLAAACVLSSPSSTRGQADSCDIHVSVINLRNDRGEVEVALYNSSDTFLGDSAKVFRTADGKPEAGTSRVVFQRIPFGTYAIAVFHDENLNRKMDKGMFGIPKEGYCFSNDAMGFMRAPDFDQAKFICDRDSIEVVIKMKYRPY